MFWAEIWKISEFLPENYQFWWWNFQVIWQGEFSSWFPFSLPLTRANNISSGETGFAGSPESLLLSYTLPALFPWCGSILVSSTGNCIVVSEAIFCFVVVDFSFSFFFSFVMYFFNWETFLVLLLLRHVPMYRRWRSIQFLLLNPFVALSVSFYWSL